MNRADILRRTRKARHAIANWLLAGDAPDGLRGIYISDAGARLRWIGDVTGHHVFGATVGFDATGGHLDTIFAPK